jgi:RNA polymerase sigma-70 factor (ECF subfamily)
VELDAALASLPVDLRETLLLVEVLGLRYAEAATALGVPIGTVKSRMFAARAQLARWARAGDGGGSRERGHGAPVRDSGGDAAAGRAIDGEARDEL